MHNYISVVVPTYNDYMLDHCLASLHKQRYPGNKFEVIVVENPKKTDRVHNICKRYGFTHLVSELGSNRARNTGIGRAKGSIIALCDDDVLVNEFWLQQINNDFNTYDFGVLGGRVDVSTDFGAEWVKGEFLHYLSHVDYGENFFLSGGRHIVSANCAFRKETWEWAGRFNEDIGYHGNLVGNDEVEFFQTIISSKTGYYDNSLSVTHCPHPDRFKLNWFRKRFEGQGWADADLILRNHKKSVEDIYHDNIQYGNMWLDINEICRVREEICDEDVTRQYIRNLTICKTDYLVGFQNRIEEMWRPIYGS